MGAARVAGGVLRTFASRFNSDRLQTIYCQKPREAFHYPYLQNVTSQVNPDPRIRELLFPGQPEIHPNLGLVSHRYLYRYKPQLSTDFNNLWNLVRDQGVGRLQILSP